jgi:hypothetical protein
MNDFLTNYGDVGRMGLMYFPNGGGDGCVAPGLNDVVVQLNNSNDDPAALKTTASQINQSIKTTSAPSGGTPTGESLRILGTYPPLLDNSEPRQKFIVVLTDGLPNCNHNFSGATCNCTLGSASDCSGEYAKAGCLDQANTVDQVQALKNQNIKTIVIGFGADTSTSDAAQVLNAMAETGGFPRACPGGTDAECGGGSGACEQTTHLCTQRFYQAKDGSELASALAQISERVGAGDVCVYKLDAPPSDPRFLSVLVDGKNEPSGPNTWAYDASTGTVTFQGDLCTQLRNSTSDKPVNVEFRAVSGL